MPRADFCFFWDLPDANLVEIHRQLVGVLLVPGNKNIRDCNGGREFQGGV
jgi:hypothetical protein